MPIIEAIAAKQGLEHPTASPAELENDAATPTAESLPSQGLTVETDAVKLAKLTNKELVKKYRQLVPSLPDRKIQKPDSASKQTLIDEILRVSALDT